MESKKERNNHIYDGKDRKDDNVTRGGRKSQDIEENKSGKCINSK